MVKPWFIHKSQTKAAWLNEEQAEAALELDENGQQDIFNDQADLRPIKLGWMNEVEGDAWLKEVSINH